MPYGSSPLTAMAPPSPPPSIAEVCIRLTSSAFDFASCSATSVQCLESRACAAAETPGFEKLGGSYEAQPCRASATPAATTSRPNPFIIPPTDQNAIKV